jgi:beta-lactam-binding protein with PASTA domain
MTSLALAVNTLTSKSPIVRDQQPDAGKSNKKRVKVCIVVSVGISEEVSTYIAYFRHYFF